ncbi:MAG TPA: prolipoprotein diacylglyceryl transferase [Chromatiales bacterium]|nr:prolipoprotein diacylglyceryl transferase [Chromatiales bacterium]
MTTGIFVTVLAVVFGALLAWGFRTLPGERWQILATIPLGKGVDGSWRGLNLTYYGLLSAIAYAVALALLFILTGAVGVPVFATLVVCLATLSVCVPAAGLVARVVERKRHTLSVAGAFFVAVPLSPVVLWLTDYLLARPMGYRLPLLAMLAAMAIAYAVGEGLGRLACISFGCCYGRCVADAPPPVRRLFTRWHFRFSGATKKIAYASGLQDVAVVPVQALTAVLYVATALVGVALFLHARYLAAYVLVLTVTQVWRVVSETLRADYRGGGRLSAYQIMSALAAFVGILIGLALAGAPAPTPTPVLSAGLRVLWHPGVLLFVQACWLAIFLHTGRSMVTEASVLLRVRRERV